MKPIRLQRFRTRGWKMPMFSRCCTRPGKYGNPYKTAAEFEAALRSCMIYKTTNPFPAAKHMQRIAADIAELRGLNLCCFCKLPAPGDPDPCHAAVLLKFANLEER